MSTERYARLLEIPELPVADWTRIPNDGETFKDGTDVYVGDGVTAAASLTPINGGGGGGATNLNGLTDVTLTAPSNGQVLKYNGSQWVNDTDSTGGGVTDHGALTGLGDDDHTQYHNDTRGDARYAQKSNNLSDLASAATARTNLGLGTAAVVNTGTGASDVPTITQADARYAKLAPSSYLNYTGGNQVSAVTTWADIHSSAGWTISEVGEYEFYVKLVYDVNATTTGCRFGLNGTATHNFLVGSVTYTTQTGDRDGSALGNYDAGAATPSSIATTGNAAIMIGVINITGTGNLRIRFASEVAVANGLTVTAVTGLLRKRN